VFFRPIFTNSSEIQPEQLRVRDAFGEVVNIRSLNGEGPVDPPPEGPRQPPVFEEISMRTGALGALAAVSAKQRPIWESEAVRAIECSIFEDEDPELIPPDCQQYIATAGEVVDPRLELESVQAARDSYRSLFAEADEMRDVLQGAADDYRTEAGTGAVSGKGFREFLEREQAHLAALGYLGRLADLFRHVRSVSEEVESGSGELEEWRDLLVDDVTPVGLSPEELNQAIEAGFGDQQGELEGRLLASDGLPRSLRATP
jgi:hypothetical protein